VNRLKGDSGWVVGGWAGKVSKEKTRKWVRGGEKIKFQKEIEIMGTKNWEGGGEKIKLQKNTEIRAYQG
jgi:hypothetical protein